MTSSICLRTLIAAFAVMANLFVSAESVKIYYGMGDGVPFSMEEISKRNCIDVDQTSYTLNISLNASNWWVAFPKTWEIGCVLDGLGTDIEHMFSESVVDELQLGLHWKVVDDYILYYDYYGFIARNSYRVLLNKIPDATDIFEGTCGNNAMWRLDCGTGELRISGVGEIEDWNIYGRERYPWYPYRKYVYSVIIEDGIENVSSHSFQEYSEIENVIIGNDVKTIGREAFLGCASLRNITIGNSVTSIEHYAFAGCSELTCITIPNSVTSIEDDAFSGCYIKKSNFVNNSNCSSPSDWGLTLCDERTEDGLCILNNVFVRYLGNSTSVAIPNSVTSIGSSAFYGCTGLTSIEIPSSVTSIEDHTFLGCSSLTSIEIPNSVTSIGSSAFSNCSGLTSITIPNSVTSIGSSAFSNCSGLTSITIPNSVTSIGDWTFSDCSDLTSITIPNSVTSIGEGAFRGFSNIEKIEWDSNVSPYCTTRYCKDNLKRVSFGNSLISIGDFAFYGCSSLTDINIPSSVTSIGENAFSYCSNLTSITIPNSVTSIEDDRLLTGDEAFRGCSNIEKIEWDSNLSPYCVTQYCKDNLKYVSFGNSLISIGKKAFEGCSGLTNITIPNSVTSIVSSAFHGCNYEV